MHCATLVLMATALHRPCLQPCLALEHRCREDRSGAGGSAWGTDHTIIAICRESGGMQPL